MNKAVVKIREVEIHNVKNVKSGSVSFPYQNKDVKERQSEIVGIYGQNGSGKSALVNSVHILKVIMSGRSLNRDTINIINKESIESTFNFEFSIDRESKHFTVFYDFKIRKNENNIPVVFYEKLAYKDLTDESHSRTTIIESTEEDDSRAFVPQVRHDELVKIKKTFATDLIVSKKLAYEKSESFIFRDKSVAIFKEFENKDYRNIISALHFFARVNLFVVQMDHHGVINANFLIPMTMRLDDNRTIQSGEFPIEFGINKLEEKNLDVFKRLIDQMSVLINAIVPGMTLIYKEYGKETSKNGDLEYSIELLSKRGDLEIPIKYESDGIKKIISILSALIAMYNRESICVAIDELDAGIFEYLLGEILKVISDTGKGQLLFTSHNLRALEVLNKDSIYFSTTNNMNKFIRFSNIKNNHNLRNVYLRTIEIGGQKECVYEETDPYEIGRAFRMAGKTYENAN
ncbi:AAA15 family ATPase/GTPase [Acholeplasma morum]|uniref:AAA family ATPase n=1 Tax=Paracholeplasma morum TaxID=264637 RepID=UPI00195D606F|nr:AAA family ATPase [Paracholeplasma morum]MBM7453043.1 AAA15 family ATPase/GTPase [Paracholeplasma morum]